MKIEQKTTFKDHFSGHSMDYSQYRPHYPVELFAYLSSLCQTQQTAWDCATGNGQAAAMLAEHFSKVIATDASHEQLAQAVKQLGISYHVAPAEHSLIAEQNVDLITVAQAFHWFDQEAFAAEVKRVLKPQGILAIWTYNLLSINPLLDRIIAPLYDDILGDYWAFERTLVESGYAEVSLPFTEIRTPEFRMQSQWNLAQLVGYLQTWSAVKKYEEEQGENPIAMLYDELLKAWGEANNVLVVEWPLSLRVWQKAT